MNPVKEIIVDKGLKSIWICQQLGINRTNFSLFLNGWRPLSAVYLNGLAKILNCSESLIRKCNDDITEKWKPHPQNET